MKKRIKYKELSIKNEIKKVFKLLPNTYSLIPNKGFTLVEMIIYLGLLMLMLLIFTEIFASIIDNQLSSRNTSSTADDGRHIYSRFIYDVSRADAITQPGGFGSASASLTLTIGGSDFTYEMSGDNLMVTDGTGTQQINSYATAISDLTFTKVGSSSAQDTVQINFIVTGRINQSGIVDQQIYQTTAGIR